MSLVNEWAFIGVFMAIAWIFPAAPLVDVVDFPPAQTQRDQDANL